MHRITEWRRRKADSLGKPLKLELGRKTKTPRKHLLRLVSEWIANKVADTDLYSQPVPKNEGFALDLEAFLNGKTVNNLKLPDQFVGLQPELYAIAFCDIYGYRRAQKQPSKSGSRECPSKRVPGLSRRMVAYWRNHKDYQMARLAVAYIIKYTDEVEYNLLGDVLVENFELTAPQPKRQGTEAPTPPTTRPHLFCYDVQEFYLAFRKDCPNWSKEEAAAYARDLREVFEYFKNIGIKL